MEKYSIGLDFGTESARAVLVNVATGETATSAVSAYPDGVIDRTLPNSSAELPPDWALQNPADWLISMETAVSSALSESGIAPDSVIGLGLDFTACTVLPVTAEGVPLCQLEEYRNWPHSWAKLWKHHAAQPQADRVTELAAEQGQDWLARYGGKISSEWLVPKALQILEEAPALYARADRIVEGADWVVCQLTSRLVRNACAAGYKAMWHKSSGFPSSDYLSSLHTSLSDLYTHKLRDPVVAPGERVGGLTDEWAARLGLPPGTPVAAPIIDAHAAVPGGGISQAGIMFMIMGTSTCHMLMADSEVQVEGISGVVEDGIVPGLFGYEAGQAGVGDIFAWFVDNSVPPDYHRQAKSRDCSLHDVLGDKAAHLKPGRSGLLALDWWNGCRSTLVDAELSGLLVGCTLSTKAEEIYRALIESTAFGTRVIIETFSKQGIPVDSLVCGGGLAKNSFLMQIYADVTGREISVAGSDQVSALGAAMLGTVAAGQSGKGYPNLSQAVAAMAPPPSRVYRPTAGHRTAYETLYSEYRRLYDHFGRETSNVMKVLRELRRSS